MQAEIVSIREFSRRVGVSDTAIRKAIADGRITTRASRTNDKNGRPELFYDVALKDWQQAGGGVVKIAIESRANTAITDKQKQDAPPPGVQTFTEARRRAQVYTADMKGLELAERKGVLVQKSKVYEELFEFGQQIKSSLQSIPDKYIDLIFSAASVDEARVILKDAIYETLEILSRGEDLKI